MTLSWTSPYAVLFPLSVGLKIAEALPRILTLTTCYSDVDLQSMSRICENAPETDSFSKPNHKGECLGEGTKPGKQTRPRSPPWL